MHRALVVSALVFLLPAGKTAPVDRSSWLKGYLVGCRAAARQIFQDLRRHCTDDQWRAALDFARRHSVDRRLSATRRAGGAR